MGRYHLGQGYHGGEEPVLEAKVKAKTFEIACLKHKLRERIKSIEYLERNGREDEIGQHHLEFKGYDFNKGYIDGWLNGYYPKNPDLL